MKKKEDSGEILLSEDEYKKLISENDRLRELVGSLLSRSFGRHTESLSSLYGRNSLLDESGAPVPTVEPEPESQDVQTYSRRKPRPRKGIPDDLPRVDVDAEEAEDLKKCPKCGSTMEKISEKIVEKLVYEPARLYVERLHIPVYRCNSCPKDSTPGIATMRAPLQLIRGGIVDTRFVVTLIVQKYINAMPIYRQHADIVRMGGRDIALSVMYSWLITAYDKSKKLIPLLYEELRNGTCLHLDETPVQVLKEIGRKDTQKSYTWCAVGGGEHRVVIFRYDRERKGTVADKIIGSFKGYVQTDEHSGYDHLAESPGIHHVFCLAHIRRKFADIVKASGKKDENSVSVRIVKLIAEVYQHEKKLRSEYDLSKADQRERFLLRRKDEVLPIFGQIKAILQAASADPKSKLGKAIKYACDCWSGMLLYLDCPDLTPDNNAAENAIRPYVIGRKNWLFAGCPAGAEASAFFYTLVETAKANGLNPAAYISFVIQRSLTASTEEDYRAMLPWNDFQSR